MKKPARALNRKQMSRAIQQFRRSALRGDTDALFDLFDQILRLNSQLNTGASQVAPGFYDINDMLNEEVERISLQDVTGTYIGGIPTGFTGIDKLIGGLQRSGLTVLAGYPSTGKTTLMLNIVRHTLFEYGLPAAICSPKVRMNVLVRRLLSLIGGIDQEGLRDADLDADGWKRYTDATSRLHGMPLFMCDRSNISASELSVWSRSLYSETQLDLLVIDDVELLQRQVKLGSRETGYLDALNTLRALAMDLDIAVVAIARLDDTCWKAQNRAPVLSDVYGASAVEKLADTILLLHYDREVNQTSSGRGIVELIVEKQATGPTGACRLVFDPRHAAFVDY